MPFLLLLLPLLAKIPGMIGDYYSKRLDLEVTKVNTAKEVELAKAQMATDIAKAELANAQQVVLMTSTTFRTVMTCLVFTPFAITMISSKWSAVIFANFSLMPAWYSQICLTIILAIYGITVGAPVVKNIFDGLGTYLDGKRNYILEKAKINRKVFFDSLRKDGALSQQEVDEANKALDEAEK